MGLLDAVLGHPGALEQLAKTVGLDAESARRGVQALVPAVSQGMRRNAARDEGGLAGLLGALGAGGHEEIIDRPEQMADPRVREQGNALLGQIFGSKEVSRSVAANASAESGLSDGVLKQMLPLVASLVAGSLGKSAASGAASGTEAPGAPAAASDSGVFGMLEQMLDSDRDGQVLDDVFSLAKKLF